MSINYEYLLSKINELERKVFELELKVNKLENSTQTKQPTQEEEKKYNTRIERYLFEGNYYKKSRLVLAVINKYVYDHPNITAEELDEAFPSRKFKLSTFSCVKKFENIPANHKDPEKVKRYFIDEDTLITLNDGTKMAVCTQWGTNIILFIEHVKKFGYEISLYSNLD